MIRPHTNDDSSRSWVVRLPAAQATLSGMLRLLPDIEVLLDQAHVWLRGTTLSDELLNRIRTIPDAELFSRTASDRLVRWGMTVPWEILPEGTWTPLVNWLKLELPRAAFAGRITANAALKLVRTSAMSRPNTMCLEWVVWRNYATSAPLVRLNGLSFAKSSDNQVLIHGTPLPPLNGRTFVEISGVMMPSGWRFEPDVGHRAAASLLSLGEVDYALLELDGSFVRVARSAFVKASRAAVRASDG